MPMKFKPTEGNKWLLGYVLSSWLTNLGHGMLVMVVGPTQPYLAHNVNVEIDIINLGIANEGICDLVTQFGSLFQYGRLDFLGTWLEALAQGLSFEGIAPRLNEKRPFYG